jgi:hypothetical protein
MAMAITVLPLLSEGIYDGFVEASCRGLFKPASVDVFSSKRENVDSAHYCFILQVFPLPLWSHSSPISRNQQDQCLIQIHPAGTQTPSLTHSLTDIEFSQSQDQSSL